ncbi:MAG: CDP-alcohol phosphatidyltransferase family protein [Pseudomonadota bacterium]
MSSSSLLRQLPNALTLGNAVAGVLAVMLCVDAVLQGDLAGGLQRAFALIALGVLCDTLDGPLARALKANNPLGAQLDSLCDGATFGVATALIIAIALWTLSPVLAAVLAALWASAVLLRLARFNLDTDTTTAHFFFTGMCSPVASLFVVAALAATVGTGLFPWLPLLLASLLPALMLSRIVFADLPKHYLARRRAPWDLLVAAMALFFIDTAAAVFAFLLWFLLQSLWLHLRGKPSQ